MKIVLLVRNSILIPFFLLLCTFPTLSVGIPAHQPYIESFSSVAVKQMVKYQIPASITLGQGILESGFGQSQLAANANNHFGIKAFDDWNGKSVLYKGEQYRKYTNAEQSFEDHSLFLIGRDRYHFLFELDLVDYKGWAYGLKEAGYAQDPNYPTKLIDVIEANELWRYDVIKTIKTNPLEREPHRIFTYNGVTYTIAQNGDNIYSIAKIFTLTLYQIELFNDVYPGYQLFEGDVVYLDKKKRKASDKYSIHTVKPNDSMHSISQRYAMRMRYLYRMNNKKGDYEPQVGDRLFVR